MAKSGTSDFYNGVATQSLRFEDGSSTYLTKTFSSDGTGSGATCTFSCWIKRNNISNNDQWFFTAGPSSPAWLFGFRTADTLAFGDDDGNPLVTVTDRVFRDTSAWYHLVLVVKTSESSNADKYKIYVNGELQATTFSGTAADTLFGANVVHNIGRYPTGSTYVDLYMSDLNFVDGLALDPTYFAESKNGVWIPKEPVVSEYGTNGFRFKFDQVGVGTASTSTIGADTSGKTNHFTSSGIVASDCAMPDSPENNFATLNPLKPATYATYSEGNLKLAHSTNGWAMSFGTFSVSSGKWYFENVISAGSNLNSAIGFALDTVVGTTSDGNTAGSYMYANDGNKYINGTGSTYGDAWGDGEVVACVLDLDNNTIQWYNENAGQGVISSIPAGSYSPFISIYYTDTRNVVNFGQDSSFSGKETAQGNTDGNGIGDFYYAPPSGYLALCTANLPEPTIGPNSTSQADDYFNTVLYTSDNIGADGTQNVTGVGFKPDWVWLKNRTSNSTSHTLYDSNRGTGRHNSPDSNIGEVGLNSEYGYLGTFGDDGYTLRGGSTNANYVNQSTDAYASWNWKSNGGVTSTLTDGSINTTVQVNATAGFSIMTFVSDNQNGTTLAHGLGVAPAWFIIKDRDEDNAFYHYHKGLGSGKFTSWGAGSLGTGAPETSTTVWGNTDPTSTLITVGIGNMSFDNGHNIVAYAFAEIEGYSKFGSYTGNGSADGTFVYLGFRPAFFMTKRTDATANWVSVDTAQNPYNVTNAGIQMNTNLAQGTGYANDFLSNGMKIRVSGATVNASGGTYIYMAFAEAPFKYANSR